MAQVAQGCIANSLFMRPMSKGFARASMKPWLPVSAAIFDHGQSHAGQSLVNGRLSQQHTRVAQNVRLQPIDSNEDNNVQ